MIDWTVDQDGIIHGIRGQYDRSERYVKCRHCTVLRPGINMRIMDAVPMCKDHFNGPDRPKTVAVQKLRAVEVEVHLQQSGKSESPRSFVDATDAPACKNCGDITVRSGTCHKCMNCGETSGCS